MVKVIPLEDAERAPQRLGFMAGRVSVPDDFDTLEQDDIARLFGTVDDGNDGSTAV